MVKEIIIKKNPIKKPANAGFFIINYFDRA